MTEVWKDAPVSGTELLMLLALADSCNDDRECWPSVRHLMHKARLSEAQARRVLKSLERQGVIEIGIKQGKGVKGRESNRYRVCYLTPIADDTSTPRADDTSTGIADDTLNHHYETSYRNNTPKPPKGAGKAAAPKAYPDSYELRKWSDALVSQALAEFDETIHALLMAWGDSDLYPTARNMLKRDQLKYIETARGLIKVGCLPVRFQSLAIYTRATLSWRNNPLVVTDMLGQYSNWLKAQQKRITLETYETPAVDAYPRTDDYLQVDGLGNWIGGSK